MSQRSKVMQLPGDIRERLDRELIDRGFGDYGAISDLINGLIAEAGYEITLSRSGIHRYGQEFEARIMRLKVATEQAIAITDAVGDDAGKMGGAMTSMLQEGLFDLLVRVRDSDEIEVKDYGKLADAVAKLNNSAVRQKKWQSEVFQQKRAAADRVEKLANAGGLAPETIQSIRNEILGIGAAA